MSRINRDHGMIDFTIEHILLKHNYYNLDYIFDSYYEACDNPDYARIFNTMMKLSPTKKSANFYK